MCQGFSASVLVFYFLMLSAPANWQSHPNCQKNGQLSSETLALAGFHVLAIEVSCSQFRSLCFCPFLSPFPSHLIFQLTLNIIFVFSHFFPITMHLQIPILHFPYPRNTRIFLSRAILKSPAERPHLGVNQKTAKNLDSRTSFQILALQAWISLLTSVPSVSEDDNHTTLLCSWGDSMS